MSNAMRRCAMAAVICLATASAARAQGLPDVPTGTVLSEVMMDVQGSEAQLYSSLLGSTVAPQTLSGTSMTDLATASFSFSLNPGSTYMGQLITDSVTGQYNLSDGSYDYTSTGASALGVSWNVTGSIVVAEVDLINGNVTWTLTSTEVDHVLTSFPGKPVYRVSDTVTVFGMIGGPFFSLKTSNSLNGRNRKIGLSFSADTYNPLTGELKFEENDLWKPFRRHPPHIVELASLDVTSGTNPSAGGPGTYTTTISSIPEPSSLIMAVIGMGTALWYRLATTLGHREAGVMTSGAIRTI